MITATIAMPQTTAFTETVELIQRAQAGERECLARGLLDFEASSLER